MEKTLEKKKHSLIYEEQLMEMHIMGKLIMLQERRAEARYYDRRSYLRHTPIVTKSNHRKQRNLEGETIETVMNERLEESELRKHEDRKYEGSMQRKQSNDKRQRHDKQSEKWTDNNKRNRRPFNNTTKQTDLREKDKNQEFDIIDSENQSNASEKSQSTVVEKGALEPTTEGSS